MSDKESQKPEGAAFDEFAATYSAQIDKAVSFSGLEQQFFIDAKRNRLVELVQRHHGLAANADALDFGCGVGAYHNGLKGVFRSLSAIDVSRESIELARTNHPEVNYAIYDGAALPYPDASFDVVFAICVLHHVPPAEWASLAGELHRVLRADGLCIIFEHNPLNPATQYIVRTCPIDRDANLLSRRRTRKLLGEAKLDMVESRSILTIPPVNRLADKIDHLLGLVPFGAQYYVASKKR